MIKTAIVILNWNGRKYLEQFLPTLLQRIPDDAEVIIADNASSDDSISFLQTHYPHLRLIQHLENGGFSKGYNEALQQIDATYYCLLNSDIEVAEKWVEPIVEMLDSDFNIAVVQPKILDFQQRNKFEYAGASGGFMDRWGYPFCRGRVFDTLEEDHGQYDNSIEIFWATGAAMFVRSDIYHQLGGLDEDFFAHMEEIDFCWRVKNWGYKIMVQPQSVVYHIGGGTLPKNNAFKTFLNFRNNLFLLLKNLPSRKLFPTFCFRFLMDNLAAFVFLLQGNKKDFLSVYKAWKAFFQHYQVIKNKRDKEKIGAFAFLYKHSIVFIYNVLRKKRYNGNQFLN